LRRYLEESHRSLQYGVNNLGTWTFPLVARTVVANFFLISAVFSFELLVFSVTPFKIDQSKNRTFQ